MKLSTYLCCCISSILSFKGFVLAQEEEFGMCAMDVLHELECSSGTAISVSKVQEILEAMGGNPDRNLAVEIGACDVRCKAIGCIMSVVWDDLSTPACGKTILSQCQDYDNTGASVCKKVAQSALSNYADKLAPFVAHIQHPCGYCSSKKPSAPNHNNESSDSDVKRSDSTSSDAKEIQNPDISDPPLPSLPSDSSSTFERLGNGGENSPKPNTETDDTEIDGLDVEDGENDVHDHVGVLDSSASLKCQLVAGLGLFLPLAAQLTAL